MNGITYVELKSGSWKAGFDILSFIHDFTIGGSGNDIVVPSCPENVSLGIHHEPSKLGCNLHGAVFAASALNNIVVDRTVNTELTVCNESNSCPYFSIVFKPSISPAPAYDICIEIPENKKISVGAQENADIQNNHPLINGNVFTLLRKANQWEIYAGSSTPLGVYMNTTRVEQVASATSGDFITALGIHLFCNEDRLYLSTNDPVLIRTLRYNNQIEYTNREKYPCMARMARTTWANANESIEIQDPSAPPQESKNNIVISLLPSIATILLTVFLRGSYSSNAQMILFSTLTMAIGAITSVFTYIQTSKEQKTKNEQRIQKYREYIEQQRKKIIEARKEERDILRKIYSDVDTQIDEVNTFSATLFDRRPEDDDFLNIRFGYGRLRSQRQVAYQQHGVFDSTDELFLLPKQLFEEFEYNTGMPAYINGKAADAIGIVGGYSQLKNMLKIITLDLAVRHYFDDVRLHYILSDNYKNEAHAFRLLPHVCNAETQQRNIAYDDESRKTQLEYLFKIFSGREGDERNISKPWHVVFIDTDDAIIMQHPLMKFVVGASKLNVLFVFLSKREQQIPQGCTQLIRLMNNVNMGAICSLNQSSRDQLFEYEAMSTSRMIQVGSALAPVYSGETKLASHLSGKESLFDMLGISNAASIDIAAKWSKANTTKGLSAPLGIMDNGDVLCLDLHENAHGPHGLVAGMTGSGKSQVLISYILSLAANYSPEDITFAVIDFKGGDIVKQLAGLPHIVGSITNIASNEISRSLQSINAEKNKRMVLFDKDHANVSNITEYTKAYKAGKTNVPLPHLVIIVDEFAELKSQYPDFMQELISIARVGRSLGIHLILCTQKPAGIVDDQIWSNSNFHLCLRVQNKQDSNDVLHSPLASEIREPGRGYLQIENQFFELFQSGYSGCSENIAGLQETAYQVEELDLAGRPSIFYRHEVKKNDQERTQREAILETIINTFNESRIAPPQQLCQPPIPAVLPYEKVAFNDKYDICIGIYDDPSNQAIRQMTVEVANKNLLIVGSSQMGKTNLLQTLIRQMAEALTPNDVTLYVLDYNAKAICSMQDLSIIGGVITEDEEEKLRSLIRLLKQSIGERKIRFAQQKVTNFNSYCAMCQDMPAIVVMIDNYAAFHELYEESYGNEMLMLMREGASYGISFVVTLQQMTEMPYRKHSQFTQRLVLPLSEQTAYSSVLDGCRRTLEEIPGRLLFAQSKKIYEAQVFEAFSGDTELEKTQALQAFVKIHSAPPKAQAIPSVPSILTMQYLKENYPQAFGKGIFPCAMAYEDVSPVCIDMNRMFSLSLIGGSEQQRNRFIMQLLRDLVKSESMMRTAKLYVFDNLYKTLRACKGHPAVGKYSCTAEDLNAVFSQLMAELESNKNAVSDEDEPEVADGTVVLINSYEILKYLSENALLIQQFKTLAEQARRINVFFLFSDIPNKATKYSSPEILHYIAEEKQMILFGDMSTMKICSIDYATLKEHSRPLNADEAFLLSGDDIIRMKLCDA